MEIPEDYWEMDSTFSEDFKYVFNEENEVKNRAKDLMDMNRDKFTLKNMSKLLNEVVDKYSSDIPTQVGLNLPKLKKAGSSKPPKLNLPKLKKVTQSEGAAV